mmetsp:Transcript_34087/g.78616  ORF Transcript_34087/g.78616 Transcript_34087/m.78616 type:complete len:216 (+) Transcript_34087:741-1388(+)
MSTKSVTAIVVLLLRRSIVLGWTSQVHSHTELIQQELRCLQNIPTIDLRNDIRQKVIDMSQKYTMNHIHPGSSQKDAENNVGKGHVHSFERDTPNIPIGGRVAFGPNVKDVEYHVSAENVTGVNTEHGKERFEQNGRHGTKHEHKDIVGRAASCSGIEWTTRLVLRTKTHLQIKCDQCSDFKRTGITKACSKPPDFELFHNVGPSKGKVHGTHNT